jgi:sialic acid synthase SpsE
VSADEAKGKLKARRSLFLARDARKGDALTEDMLDWRRPGTGIVPAEARHALGRTLVRDLARGTQVTWSDLA